MKLLRLVPVLGLTGVSRSTHYQQIKDGLMTAPVQLSAHSVAWPEREISAINAARVAGKSDDEIRQLVAKLMADRKTLGTEVAV
jgi:prophage regulatory protein